MKDIDIQEFDGDAFEHDPADLPQPDDTEDVALEKFARRISRVTGIPAASLLPRLRRLTIAEQLRQERLNLPDSSEPRKRPQNPS
jgi:hypothetical protein